MDLFSARLTRLSTQRIIRGFVALLVTSVTFWCLISGDDSRPKPSSRRSEGITPAPRATAKMQTPGEIAGLVLGIILGVLAVGVIVLGGVFCLRCRGYRGPDSTAETLRETHWNFRRARPALPEEGYRRTATEILINDMLLSTQKGYHGGDSAGPPMQFWKPTEMERDLASRISLDAGPSIGIPASVKQTPLKISEHDPVSKLSNPDLERTAIPAPPDSSDVAVTLPALDHLATHHTSSQPSLSSQALPERQSLSSAERSPEDDEVAAPSSQFPCREPSCTRTFSKQYKLNHHIRYHAKSKQCPTCSKSFGTVTHLERHINSAHSSTRRYHCTVESCKYSKTVGGDAVFFSRKDNWRRHMKDRHGLT